MTETEDYDKSATPKTHHVSHENGGSDEISAEGLAGELANEQKSEWSKVSGKPATFPPEGHHGSHENGGSDEISAEGLAGELANEQKSEWSKVSGKPATFPPEGHHGSHENGGSDEMDVTNLVGTTPRAILGDSTAGRVLRKCWLHIEDGTNANTIALTIAARWNGNSLAKIDNIAKGSSGTYINLSADGKILGLKNTIWTGNIVSVLASIIYQNTTTIPLTTNGYVSSAVMTIKVYHGLAGGNVDLTFIVQTGEVRVSLAYITTE